MDVHVSLVGRTDLAAEIYRQLRQAILDGRLRPNDRLPPTREMAKRLSVSRTTVTVAYDRLSAAGYLTARVGAGTYVREHVAVRPGEGGGSSDGDALRARPVWASVGLSHAFDRPARYDFRSGLPDASLFPFATWRRLVSRETRVTVPGAGVYGAAAGDEGLRAAIARHVGVSRGVEANPADIVVTNGTQQALDLLCRVLLEPGDVIAVEDPGYVPPRLLFRTHGARVVGVPVDDEGVRVDALPARARIVYTTPSHQYPLGMVLSLRRRIALLEWAEQNDAAIIEDDYDSEFRFGGRPIEPLRTLDDRGRVAYVGSFSKTMLPTLRLGFVLVPPSLRDAVQRAKFVTDWHTATPLQRALARFIDNGGFARHIRRMNRVYEARHELIRRTVERDFAQWLRVVPSEAGLHVSAVAHEDDGEAVSAITSRAADRGVAVQRLARLGVDSPGPAGVLLGYGAIATDDIAEGLRILRRCFAS